MNDVADHKKKLTAGADHKTCMSDGMAGCVHRRDAREGFLVVGVKYQSIEIGVQVATRNQCRTFSACTQAFVCQPEFDVGRMEMNSGIRKIPLPIRAHYTSDVIEMCMCGNDCVYALRLDACRGEL
ncbi:hypothetical protein P4608_24850 [Ensifer adhaerens]|nr:hypothetical protein [Ensifer adhaerens]MDF8357317.1 hypothetical protein [Ensifer adhaerens]